MNGEKPDEYEIPVETKERVERLDFDYVFSSVQNKLNGILHDEITSKVGITRLTLGYDSSGEPLRPDIDYENTLERIKISSDGNDNEILVMVRPGGAAVDRFWGALDDYLVEPEAVSTLRTTAHEMYSCSLIVNAFMLAAQRESSDEARELYSEPRKIIERVNFWLNSESARGSIRESDFKKKDELLALMDYLTDTRAKLMTLNSHRFAAGVFYYMYQGENPRVKDEITYALKQKIETELARDLLDDETMLEKLGVLMPRPEDVIIAEEVGVEASIIEGYELINTTRAEKLDIDIVGWAFPMSPKEVSSILISFKR